MSTTERKPIRPFGPSNRPDTCLYCGAGLKHDVFKGSTHKTAISLCCRARVEQRTRRTPTSDWDVVLACTGCGRELVGDAEDTEVRTTVVPERRSRDKGYAGYFCTRSCGYRFGLLAARQGVRYRQRAEP
jgi:hypothetical protein